MSDKLGRLRLTIAECRQRYRIVLGMACDTRIPVAVTMGGGYSDHIRDVVEAHANTCREAQEIYF
ncbi:MAG: hypothetical protein R3301_01765 [Saprospiraceae bacterium]|nr:hypothetical protein [Saprospiraceae bacterium]